SVCAENLWRQRPPRIGREVIGRARHPFCWFFAPSWFCQADQSPPQLSPKAGWLVGLLRCSAKKHNHTYAPLAGRPAAITSSARIALDCSVTPIQQLEVIEDGWIGRFAL